MRKELRKEEKKRRERNGDGIDNEGDSRRGREGERERGRGGGEEDAMTSPRRYKTSAGAPKLAAKTLRSGAKRYPEAPKDLQALPWTGFYESSPRFSLDSA